MKAFSAVCLKKNDDKLNTKAVYAAPFFNENSSSPLDGMEKSYEEIFRVMKLLKVEKPVYKGSTQYLPDEKTPVDSEAARDLAERVKNYSPEHPLYVVAIGAITNIASAILLNPQVAENIVVVWLGGHAHDFSVAEFNMMQDVAAARVVFGCGVPLVQLPCRGVVSSFTLSKPELEAWFYDKGDVADYLSRITVEHVEKTTSRKCWSKVIWDVTAVAWLLNDEDRFMKAKIITAPLPSYDNLYTQKPGNHSMRYVYFINKDVLMTDLIEKITR